MNKISQQIAKYNESNILFFDERDDFNKLIELQKATVDELLAYEKIVGTGLPEALKDFYMTLGGLQNKNNEESYCITIFSIPEMLETLKTEELTTNFSLGIIDMILFSWGNDRYEFADGEFFSKEQKDFLNTQYKCFGWYRTDTVLDCAYYLYFDANGNFGALCYDQDMFEEVQEDLIKMLENSLANETLENLLSNAIEQMRLVLIEWNE
jgi:hypothetical protein